MSGTWAQQNAILQGLLAQRRARQAATKAAAAVPTTAPTIGAPMAFPDAVEAWQGGANAGGFGAPEGPPGDMGKMFGDISPGTVGGMLGALGGGLALGPVGGLLGGLAGRGIAGLLGGAGGFGGAGGIGNDAKDLSGMNQLGGLDGMEAAALGLDGIGGMGMANAEKDGENNAFGGWQRGGYTGAGSDGRVQPWKVAGMVHEGELVIPHHMVRRLARGMLG